ncbi:MAG TPA: hypothetical protein VN627_09185 [Novosphingobium sp.]|nr:hypothetical protein [Novosphingobium sp.]
MPFPLPPAPGPAPLAAAPAVLAAGVGLASVTFGLGSARDAFAAGGAAAPAGLGTGFGGGVGLGSGVTSISVTVIAGSAGLPSQCARNPLISTQARPASIASAAAIAASRTGVHLRLPPLLLAMACLSLRERSKLGFAPETLLPSPEPSNTAWQ